MDELLRDARKNANSSAVSVGALPERRGIDFYRYLLPPPTPNPAVVEGAWGEYVPSADPPRVPETVDFSFYGMMRLGIVLLTIRRFRWLRWFAKLLIRFSPDPGGLFCSEFMAKAISQAGGEFWVNIEKERFELVTPRIAKRLAAHELGTQDVTQPQIEQPSVDELAARILELRTELGSLTEPTVCKRVGTKGGEVPAVFVTPNDLARSRNSQFASRREPTNRQAVVSDE